MDQGVKDQPFTEEQKSYLEGFCAGGGRGRTMRSLPTLASALGLKPEQLPGNGHPPRESGGRRPRAFRNVIAGELPATVEALLRAYVSNRLSPAETFNEFVRRHSVEQLRELSAAGAVAAA